MLQQMMNFFLNLTKGSSHEAFNNGNRMQVNYNHMKNLTCFRYFCYNIHHLNFIRENPYRPVLCYPSYEVTAMSQRVYQDSLPIQSMIHHTPERHAGQVGKNPDQESCVLDSSTSESCNWKIKSFSF